MTHDREALDALQLAHESELIMQGRINQLIEALREQVAECFDDRCEMCARHEAIIARIEGGAS